MRKRRVCVLIAIVLVAAVVMIGCRLIMAANEESRRDAFCVEMIIKYMEAAYGEGELDEEDAFSYGDLYCHLQERIEETRKREYKYDGINKIELKECDQLKKDLVYMNYQVVTNMYGGQASRVIEMLVSSKNGKHTIVDWDISTPHTVDTLIRNGEHLKNADPNDLFWENEERIQAFQDKFHELIDGDFEDATMYLAW